VDRLTSGLVALLLDILSAGAIAIALTAVFYGCLWLLGRAGCW
jgi:hypothetical protein